MRRWLADPNDGAAADAIEAERARGRHRPAPAASRRCLRAAMPTTRCRNRPRRRSIAGSCPGSSRPAVEAELQRLAGPEVEVEPDPLVHRPADAGLAAARRRRPRLCAMRSAAFHGPAMPVIPTMSTGATDGSFFRAAGIPVYGVDGSWGISPDDERAHGLDERIPVTGDVRRRAALGDAGEGAGGRELAHSGTGSGPTVTSTSARSAGGMAERIRSTCAGEATLTSKRCVLTS